MGDRSSGNTSRARGVAAPRVHMRARPLVLSGAALSTRGRRPLETAAITAALLLLLVMVGGAALAAESADAGSSSRSLAANGNWLGKTSQNRVIFVHVRAHRVIEVPGVVVLRSAVSFIPDKYCNSPRTFKADLTIRPFSDTSSTRARFKLYISPYAWVSGQIVNSRKTTGTISFGMEGSRDPCQADVHYSAHPTSR